jgi:hypothetical protein
VALGSVAVLLSELEQESGIERGLGPGLSQPRTKQTIIVIISHRPEPIISRGLSSAARHLLFASVRDGRTRILGPYTTDGKCTPREIYSILSPSSSPGPTHANLHARTAPRRDSTFPNPHADIRAMIAG